MKVPKLPAARSASEFEPRVRRDKDAAAKSRAGKAVKDHLEKLVLADGKGLAGPDEAAGKLAELWPKPNHDWKDHNDLAVAFAWLERWKEALTEVGEAEKAVPDDDAKKRVDDNRSEIVAAQKAARG